MLSVDKLMSQLVLECVCTPMAETDLLPDLDGGGPCDLQRDNGEMLKRHKATDHPKSCIANIMEKFPDAVRSNHDVSLAFVGSIELFLTEDKMQFTDPWEPTNVSRAGTWILDFVRSAPDTHRVVILKYMDRIPDQRCALVLKALVDLLRIYVPFLKPLMGGGAYPKAYVDKVVARTFRAAKLPITYETNSITSKQPRSLRDHMSTLEDYVVRCQPHTCITFESSASPLTAYKLYGVGFEIFTSPNPTKYRDTWKDAWKRFHPMSHELLSDVVGSHMNGDMQVVMAGGFCSELVTNELRLTSENPAKFTGDIDLYVIRKDANQTTFQDNVINLACTLIKRLIMKACRVYSKQALKSSVIFAFRTTQTLTISIMNEYDNSTAQTWDKLVPFQISMRLFEEIPDIFLSYDLDPCCVAFDGETVYMTRGAAAAISSRQTTIDPLQHTRVERVVKYWKKKGFTIHVPLPPDLASFHKLQHVLNSLGPVNAWGYKLKHSSTLAKLMNGQWNVAQVIAAHVSNGILGARYIQPLKGVYSDADNNSRMFQSEIINDFVTWICDIGKSNKSDVDEYVGTGIAAFCRRYKSETDPVIITLSRMLELLNEAKDDAIDPSDHDSIIKSKIVIPVMFPQTGHQTSTSTTTVTLSAFDRSAWMAPQGDPGRNVTFYDAPPYLYDVIHALDSACESARAEELERARERIRELEADIEQITAAFKEKQQLATDLDLELHRAKEETRELSNILLPAPSPSHSLDCLCDYM